MEFRDDSQITGDKRNRLCLKEREEVLEVIRKTPSPLVIAKSMLDSQRTSRLLGTFPRSKAIWMFRSLRGTVGSSLNRHSGQIEHVQRMLQDPTDWRGEGLSDTMKDFLRRQTGPNLQRQDAAALIWLARNQSYLEQKLNDSRQTFLLNYEMLVNSAEAEMQSIYRFLNLEYPSRSLYDSIHQRSLLRGSDLGFSPEIENQCCKLEEKLVAACEARVEVPRAE